MTWVLSVFGSSPMVPVSRAGACQARGAASTSSTAHTASIRLEAWVVQWARRDIKDITASVAARVLSAQGLFSQIQVAQGQQHGHDVQNGADLAAPPAEQLEAAVTHDAEADAVGDRKGERHE